MGEAAWQDSQVKQAANEICLKFPAIYLSSIKILYEMIKIGAI
jgi:hypothetical protein